MRYRTLLSPACRAKGEAWRMVRMAGVFAAAGHRGAEGNQLPAARRASGPPAAAATTRHCRLVWTQRGGLGSGQVHMSDCNSGIPSTLRSCMPLAMVSPRGSAHPLRRGRGGGGGVKRCGWSGRGVGGGKRLGRSGGK